MTNYQRTKQISKLSLTEVCQQLRDQGYSVRIAGGMDALAFEVISPKEWFAIRTETGLRCLLAGNDPWFNA